MPAQEHRQRLEITLASVGYGIGGLLVLLPIGLIRSWYGIQIAPSLLVGGLIGLSLMLYPASARVLTELNSLPKMRERAAEVLAQRNTWLLVGATMPSFLALVVWWGVAEPSTDGPNVLVYGFAVFVAAFHVVDLTLAAQYAQALWKLLER